MTDTERQQVALAATYIFAAGPTAKERHANLRRQRDWCQEQIAENGFTFDAEYLDLAGTKAGEQKEALRRVADRIYHYYDLNYLLTPDGEQLECGLIWEIVR